MTLIDRLKSFNKTTGLTQLNEKEPLGIIDSVLFFDDDGICISRNGSVTVYRIIDNSPTYFEDTIEQMRVGKDIDRLLIALQKSTSQFEGFMEEQTRLDRSVHFVTLQWKGIPQIENSDDITRQLKNHINETLHLQSSIERRVIIGVELFPEAKSLKDIFTFNSQAASGNVTYQTFMDPYLYDYEAVDEILSSLGCRKLTRQERNRFIGWHNHGENVDIPILWGEKHAIVETAKGKEKMTMYAVDSLENSLQIPGQELLLKSMHQRSEEFPAICFIRTQLEPSRFTQKRAKRTIKNEEKQIIQDQQDGELPDEELKEKYHGAYQLRQVLQGDDRPTLKETSIVFGVMSPYNFSSTGELFKDQIENSFGVKLSRLTGQQLEGFTSARPGGSLEINQIPNISIKNFLAKHKTNDYSSSLIAFSGATLNGNIGDNKGYLIGRNLPNGEPHFIDPQGPVKDGRSPAWLIMGEPGSGKSHVLKNLILQAKLNEEGAVLIHPKRDLSLKNFSKAYNIRFIDFNPSDKNSRGMLDPFLYIKDRRVAAQMSADFLLNVIIDDLTGKDRNDIMNAFLAAANNPKVDCGAKALMLLPDTTKYTAKDIRETVKNNIKENGASSLVYALNSDNKINFSEGEKNTSIVHIGEEFELKGNSLSAKTNRELLKLMVLESFYSLLDNGGGLFIADEAHAFLDDPGMVHRFDSIVRKGRSGAITPVFASQKVSDLAEAGFQPSRITLLMTKNKEEAEAGIKLAGLSEPYEPHIDFLGDCDYKPAKKDDKGNILSPERLPTGLMMDLSLRNGRIVLGPHLEEVLTVLNDKNV